MDKYQNKYRIPSARLQGYDYGSNGAYFITICTKDRAHYFGEIVETQFIASQIGKLAEKYWMEIPYQFPFVELGDFVVMPNHTHGILIIDKTDSLMDNVTDITNATDNVETRLIASLRYPTPPKSITPITKTGGVTGNKNPMFHENISRIIRWYKGRCSFEIRKIHADFAWQPRFHDHIIRNAKSFETISNYIVKNPLNWRKDKFHV